MSLKDIAQQIDKISQDLNDTVNDYGAVHKVVSERGKAIQGLLDGHHLAPEIGQKLQSVLTSIDNSKLLVQTQTAKLEKYKMDNLGGY